MKKRFSCILLFFFLSSLQAFVSANAHNPSSLFFEIAYGDAHINDFAITAQALLGGYDSQALSAVAGNTIHCDMDEFLSSKPAVNSNGIDIQSYLPMLSERASEYDQVWYKFKTPAAIDNVLDITKTTDCVTSEMILKLAFDQARLLVPEAAAAVDAQRYSFTFCSENLVTGALWAPSMIKMQLRNERQIYIKTPTLVTCEALGGMNYCKVFTPKDAARILVDLSNANHDKIPFQNSGQPPLDLVAGYSHHAAKINWFGIMGEHFSQQAVLLLDKKYESTLKFKGTCIISPGGFIPAISMRGLGKEIASAGYIVFIVQYRTDLAFWEAIDARNGSAGNLAVLIKEQRLNNINGLPESVVKFYANRSTPVVVFGHSLGGAVLGKNIFGHSNPFDHIILYGVNSFIKAPWQKTPIAENVAAFIGSNDTLVIDDKEKVLAELSIHNVPDTQKIYRSDKDNRTLQILDDLNHFCIISDINAGPDAMWGSDGEGPAPSMAVKLLVDQLIERDILQR
ncbi:MAG: hypothetical protein GY874_01955 [Desulfobacteraceae bacterium]|nr:hypothetical protein [Desulfobacteraceae bacterium]